MKPMWFGGCVRDSILTCTPDDWDSHDFAGAGKRVSSPHSGYRAAWHRNCTDGQRRLRSDDFTAWMQTMEDGRHPGESDVYFLSLEEDLKRRDFTINAMAYHPVRGLVDLFHGMEDMQAKIIRCVGDPMERFHEDALRILRAVRFSAKQSWGLRLK